MQLYLETGPLQREFSKEVVWVAPNPGMTGVLTRGGEGAQHLGRTAHGET